MTSDRAGATDVEAEGRRIIEARFGEDHPFAAGGAGMVEFVELVAIAGRLDDEAVRRWLPRLDALLKEVRSCLPCYGKLCAYVELICAARSLAEGVRYGRALDGRVRAVESARPGCTGGRDYRAEVRAVMARLAGLEAREAGGPWPGDASVN